MKWVQQMYSRYSVRIFWGFIGFICPLQVCRLGTIIIACFLSLGIIVFCPIVFQNAGKIVLRRSKVTGKVIKLLNREESVESQEMILSNLEFSCRVETFQ